MSPIGLSRHWSGWKGRVSKVLGGPYMVLVFDLNPVF